MIDSEGYAIVSNIGNAKEGTLSSLYKFKLENGNLVPVAYWNSDYVDPISGATGNEEFRQVQVNDKNEVFVGGITSHRIVKLDNGNTIDMQGPFGITMIRNEDMSTAKMFTLPTGGDDVVIFVGVAAPA